MKGFAAFDAKGALIKNLVEKWADQIHLNEDLGFPVSKITGSNLFNTGIKKISEHCKLFGDRLFYVNADKREYVMRYASCYQQFSLLSNKKLFEKDFPFAFYEMCDCYRNEQRGEVSLLSRCRKMTMPDMHVFTRKEDEAKEIAKTLVRKATHIMKDIGYEYDFLINCSTEKAYEENKPFILDILKENDKNSVINITSKESQIYYWTINIELHISVGDGKTLEIGTIQIDKGNSARFDINWIDENKRQNNVVILHVALMGTIERALYAIFHKAIENEALPVWIAPDQVMLVTLMSDPSEKVINTFSAIKSRLESENIRVSIDTSPAKFTTKIKRASKAWVPYIILLGDRDSLDALSVVVRSPKNTNVFKGNIDEVVDMINSQIGDKPRHKLTYPSDVNKRL